MMEGPIDECCSIAPRNLLGMMQHDTHGFVVGGDSGSAADGEVNFGH
jgi:hypothetical protein